MASIKKLIITQHGIGIGIYQVRNSKTMNL